MSKLLTLTWRHVEYKAKLEKKTLLFKSKIGIFDTIFKKLGEKAFEDLEINSN